MATVTWTPGVPRQFATAPADPGSRLGGRAAVGATGGTLLGHRLSIDLPTGGLTVQAPDLSMPYWGTRLGVRRTYDSRTQSESLGYLAAHCNTDPRLHLCGNWSLDQEAHVEAAWQRTYGDTVLAGGLGAEGLFYRRPPAFPGPCRSPGDLLDSLGAWGVPRRLLDDLGWRARRGDGLYRTLHGAFALLTGSFQPESLVDGPQVRLWLLRPAQGAGVAITSRYHYRHWVDPADGRREVSPAVLVAAACDGLGHAVTFTPRDPAPPYRVYLLADGSGRTVELHLEAAAVYRDGDRPGREAKQCFVSRVVDRTRPGVEPTGYTYDAAGRLVRVDHPTDAAGRRRTVRYGYDARGLLASITDTAGHTLAVEYAADRADCDDLLAPRVKVRRLVDPVGNVIRYAYDHPSRRVTATVEGARGVEQVVEYAYTEDRDTHNRWVVRQTVRVSSGPAAPQTVTRTWGYDARFNVVARTDPLGQVSRTDHDDLNQVTRSVDAAGHAVRYRYDLQAAPSPAAPQRYDVLAVERDNVDARGALFTAVTRHAYASYDASSSPHPEDAAQSTHRRTRTTDATGRSWTAAYDDSQPDLPLQPTAEATPAQAAARAATARSYDARGDLASEADAYGRVTTHTYDDHGLRLSTTDPNGHTRYRTYDPATDRLASETDASGAGPDDPGHSRTYDYDADGRLTAETDAAGARRTYTYDGAGRLATVTLPGGGAGLTTAYAYDARGNLVGVTDARGNPSQYAYDEAGRLWQVRRGASTAAALRYRLDPAGRVVAIEDRDGGTTDLTYDALGNAVGIVEPAWPAAAPAQPGKTLAFTYDWEGRRLSVADSELPAAEATCAYDAAGRLVGRTEHDGTAWTYEYDAGGRVRRVHDGGAGPVDLRYRYDLMDRVVGITDRSFLDGPVRFTYRWTDPAGSGVNNLYRIRCDAVKLETRLRYDAVDAVVAIEQHGPPRGRRLWGLTYAYRPDRLVASIGGHQAASYDYDGAKRLTAESDAGVASAYDPAGNRLWRRPSPPAPSGESTFGAADQLLADPDAGLRFTYDAAGRMLSRSGPQGAQAEYVWDGAGRLAVARSGVTEVRFTYDADGLLKLRRRFRRGRLVEAVGFRHLGGHIACRVDLRTRPAAVTAVWARDPDGRVLRRQTAQPVARGAPLDHSAFYLYNAHDDVVEVLDAAGGRLATYERDAWGTPVGGAAPSADNPFGYAGGYTDPDLGLIQFGQRWYAPGLGRWLSQDPLGGSAAEPSSQNPYLYASDDPVNRLDRGGHDDSTSGWYVGTGYGKSAAQYYADLTVDPRTPWYVKGPAYVGGLFASLWTPTTWKKTALTLSTGWLVGGFASPPPVPQYLVHYTDLEGAVGILESGYIRVTEAGLFGRGAYLTDALDAGVLRRLLLGLDPSKSFQIVVEVVDPSQIVSIGWGFYRTVGVPLFLP